MSIQQIGKNCADCCDGVCTMNCSGATMATGSEWIAASIWAGVFPSKATADQVIAWRAAQGIEAATAAETGTGSVHESPVAVGHAPVPSHPSSVTK
jgi:hypothetical protein